MEELTQEEIKEKNKEIYKKINEYINSDDYQRVIKYAEKKEQECLKKVREERKKRKKIVAEYSELSKDEKYSEYMLDMSKQFDDSEGGKILSKEFKDQHEIAEHNIEVKEVNKETGEIFDMPLYTKLDVLKVSRRLYRFFPKKVAEIHSLYLDSKTKDIDLDPYED